MTVIIEIPMDWFDLFSPLLSTITILASKKGNQPVWVGSPFFLLVSAIGTSENCQWDWDIKNNSTWPAFVTIKKDGKLISLWNHEPYLNPQKPGFPVIGSRFLMEWKFAFYSDFHRVCGKLLLWTKEKGLWIFINPWFYGIDPTRNRARLSRLLSGTS